MPCHICNYWTPESGCVHYGPDMRATNKPGLDYKDLLLRYMAQIINQEGTAYTDFLPAEDSREVPTFTAEEAQYLIDLESECRKQFAGI